MEIAKQIAGFSGAEADDLRKAVGKKKRDLMATMEDKFLDGSEASGTNRAVAKDLWSLMTAAADYSFNKSHAACYALIAYRTAYLKANFTAEYMAALISSVMSTKDKVPFFVNRCDAMGHRRPAAGRELLGPRFRGRRNLDPLRPRRGEERRAPGGRGDHPLPRGRRPLRLDLGLLRARRLPRRQQAGDRVPGQVRRARLHGRQPPRHARGARPGPEPPGRRRRRTRAADRARSSTSAAQRPRARAKDGAAGQRLPVPADEFDQRRAAAAREGDARHLPLGASPHRRPRRAARTGRLRAAGRRRQAGRDLAHGRRHRRRGEEGAHPQRRARDVRDPRRPRGPGRALHPQRRRRGGQGDRGRPGGADPRAASTTRAAARQASSSRTPSCSSPTPPSWPRPRRRRPPSATRRRSPSRSTPPTSGPG